MFKGLTRLTALTAMVAASLSPLTYACDIDGITGIVEENSLYIPASFKSLNGITEEKFNKILDRVEVLYKPIIEAKGKTLLISRNWDDGTVNAYAQQNGNTWQVSMFGGLARHETITEDAFALVACHELGHHLGGAPKKVAWMGSSWASNEGQSDYFGNSKCLRKYMEKDDNAAIVLNMEGKGEVDQVAKARCEKAFSNENDINMCIRGSMAGLSLGNLFRALRRLETKLQFTTPDSSVVTRTNDNHPAPQCRLDTYFQGSLCDKDFNLAVSDSDAKVGYCNSIDGYTDGVRPLCWFKP